MITSVGVYSQSMLVFSVQLKEKKMFQDIWHEISESIHMMYLRSYTTCCILFEYTSADSNFVSVYLLTLESFCVCVCVCFNLASNLLYLNLDVSLSTKV